MFIKGVKSVSDEKVCIYNDLQNFRSNLHKICGRNDVSYAKFQKFLVGDRKLIRAHYYDAPLFNTPRFQEHYRGQQMLHSAINSIDDTRVILGRRVWRDKKCGKCGKYYRTTIEKGVDIRLAVDMIRGAIEDLYDIAILISGDADYAPVVETIHHVALKKVIEHACFSVGQADELKNICDRRIKLEPSTFNDMWMNP